MGEKDHQAEKSSDFQLPDKWTARAREISGKYQSWKVELKNEKGKLIADLTIYLDDFSEAHEYGLSYKKVWRARVDVLSDNYRNRGIATWLLRQGDLLPAVKNSQFPRFLFDQGDKKFIRYKSLAAKIIYDQGKVCIFFP